MGKIYIRWMLAIINNGHSLEEALEWELNNPALQRAAEVITSRSKIPGASVGLFFTECDRAFRTDVFSVRKRNGKLIPTSKDKFCRWDEAFVSGIPAGIVIKDSLPAHVWMLVNKFAKKYHLRIYSISGRKLRLVRDYSSGDPVLTPKE